MTDTKKPLSKIKSGTIARGWALAKLSAGAGARAAGHAVGSLFASEDSKPERLKSLLMAQISALTEELGQLKGSLMKVGQMLSMYGERFFPAEVNAVLKSLQSQSPPLVWESVEPVLKRQLGERLGQLEIDRTPLASASMGQVHRGTIRSTGERVAIKVQYPGIDQAIDQDLKALRSILSIAKILPKGHQYDEIFKEVRQMLHQEVDYEKEREATARFRERLSGDPRVIIPRTFDAFCTSRVLVTELIEGIPVDSPEVLALSQERRNHLAQTALEIYLREMFLWSEVQTDPHFGNYRVVLGQGGAPDRLALFDFGAVRKLPRSFIDPYREIGQGAFLRDRKRIERGALQLGFLREEDSQATRDLLIDLCLLISEPFHDHPDSEGRKLGWMDAEGVYDWKRSDLLQRAAKLGTQFALSVKLRTPPREIVFLDRKLSGTFIFLSTLGAKIRGRELLEPILRDYSISPKEE